MQAQPLPPGGDGGERGHRLLHHPAVQAQDQVAVREHAHELGRTDLGMLAVVQPQQHLVSLHLVRGQVHDGLHLKGQQAGVEGVPDPLHHQGTAGEVLVPFRGEQLGAVASGLLGLGQGEPGMGERGVAVAHGRQRHDADSDRHPYRETVHHDRISGDLLTQGVRDGQRLQPVAAVQDHRELVVTEPADGGGRERLRQTLGDRAHHRVADRVAAQVIDDLEVVDVDQQQRAGAVDPGGQPLGQQDCHRPPVEHLGERLVHGHVGELVAYPDQLGDIVGRTHDPDRRAGVAGEDVPPPFQHALGHPVGQIHTKGDLDRGDGGDRLVERVLDRRPVVGVHQQPEGVVVDPGVRRIAEHGQQLVGPLHLVGDEVPFPDTGTGDRLDMTQPPLAQPQRLLLVAPLRDISDLVEDETVGNRLPEPGGTAADQGPGPDLQPVGSAVRRLPLGLPGPGVGDDPGQRQPGLGNRHAGGVHRIGVRLTPRVAAVRRARRPHATVLGGVSAVAPDVITHGTGDIVVRGTTAGGHQIEQGSVRPDHTTVGRYHQ